MSRFAKIPDELLDSEVSPIAVRVYGCLVLHGTTPATCYPKPDRLGALVRRSPRSIPKYLTELENAGWIRREGSGFHVYSSRNSARPSRKSARPDAQICAQTGPGTSLCERDQTNGGGAMTLFDDDYTEWRPTQVRISKAIAAFGLDDEDIETTIAAVNLEARSPRQASKRWADLVRYASQDKWRNQKRGPDRYQPEPPLVPTYEPEPDEGSVSRATSAERAGALKRHHRLGSDPTEGETDHAHEDA